MKRTEQFKLISLFGDGAEHTWLETVWLGVQALKVNQKKFEKLLRQAMDYGLIKRVDTEYIKRKRQEPSYLITKEEFNYMITPKGDKCLRDEQISRGGDAGYYQLFDRTVDGRYGAEYFKPITSKFKESNAST